MADVRYQNFDLTIQKDGEDYRAKVESPAGQATGRFSVPFSDLEIENFILTTTPGRRSVRRIDTPEVAAAKKFGERLFTSIFTGEVLGRLHSALNDAYHSDDRLRVRLRLTEVPELADLPWEYLYNPSLNRFLALDDDTALVRYLELPERVRPVTVALPLNVLVAISNPNDYPRLDVEQEWANLNEALGGLEREGLLDLDLLEDATFPALRRQLSKSQYHVLHFIGHGGFDRQTEEGVLVLKDEHGRGRFVSGQQLGWLLRNHRTLALAVLNACEGARADRTDVFAGTAQSLVQQGIPAVVAMQREITDDAAKTFAHAFYSAVADGRPVEAAMTETRLAIFAEGFGLEWATPVLYMRAPDGRVFDLHAPVAQPVEPRREAPAPVPAPAVVEPEPEQALLAPVEGEASQASKEAGVAFGAHGSDITASVMKSTGEMMRTLSDDVTRKTGDLVSDRVGKAEDQGKRSAKKARGARIGWVGLAVVLVGVVAGVWLLWGWLGGVVAPGNNGAAPTATVGAAAVGGISATQTAEARGAAPASGTPGTLWKTLPVPDRLPEQQATDALAFSEDGLYLAGYFYEGSGTGGRNLGRVVVWPLSGDAPQAEWAIDGYDRVHPQMSFGPGGFSVVDARDLAVAKDGEVAILNINDVADRQSILVADLLSVCVSTDGRMLAAGSRQGGLKLLDIESGMLERELTGHQGDVESIAFSPFDAVLATTEYGQTRIWNGQNGSFQYAINHSLGVVPGDTKSLFAHDGKSIAVCSGPADCGFWNVSDGRFIGSLESEQLDTSGLGELLAIGFSADDQVFATGWEEGVVQLWRDGGLQDTLSVDLGGEKLSAMALSSDLSLVAFALDSNALQIWRMP